MNTGTSGLASRHRRPTVELDRDTDGDGNLVLLVSRAGNFPGCRRSWPAARGRSGRARRQAPAGRTPGECRSQRRRRGSPDPGRAARTRCAPVRSRPAAAAARQTGRRTAPMRRFGDRSVIRDSGIRTGASCATAVVAGKRGGRHSARRQPIGQHAAGGHHFPAFLLRDLIPHGGLYRGHRRGAGGIPDGLRHRQHGRVPRHRRGGREQQLLAAHHRRAISS